MSKGWWAFIGFLGLLFVATIPLYHEITPFIYLGAWLTSMCAGIKIGVWAKLDRDWETQ